MLRGPVAAASLVLMALLAGCQTGSGCVAWDLDALRWTVGGDEVAFTATIVPAGGGGGMGDADGVEVRLLIVGTAFPDGVPVENVRVETTKAAQADGTARFTAPYIDQTKYDATVKNIHAPACDAPIPGFADVPVLPPDDWVLTVPAGAPVPDAEDPGTKDPRTTTGAPPCRIFAGAAAAVVEPGPGYIHVAVAVRVDMEDPPSGWDMASGAQVAGTMHPPSGAPSELSGLADEEAIMTLRYGPTTEEGLYNWTIDGMSLPGTDCIFDRPSGSPAYIHACADSSATTYRPPCIDDPPS